jgi:putative transposase
MKWRDLDVGAGYYYITGTFVEWLPLLRREDIRGVVCAEISEALSRCEGSVTAFVLMPDHLHLIIYLPREGMLHAFNRHWRGRSARRIIDMLQQQEDRQTLDVLARHANGECRYALWKEQVRCLPVVTEKKLGRLVSYVHANPVRRGLVAAADEWPFSSFRFYEGGESLCLAVVAPTVR